MEELTTNFMSNFHSRMRVGAGLLIAIGLGILIVYLIGLLHVKNPKKKYDFIINNEINSLKLAGLLIIFGLVLMFENFLTFQFEIAEITPIIASFMVSFMVGALFYSGMKTVLEVYYQNFMGNRLDAIRFRPRQSPKTGNKMKLLNEEEEDTYLSKEMQVNELSLKFDYDVWIDEESGYVNIEKYDARIGAIICSNCKFRTLKEIKEEASTDEIGTEKIIKYYKCTYCKHAEQRELKLEHIT